MKPSFRSTLPVSVLLLVLACSFPSIPVNIPLPTEPASMPPATVVASVNDLSGIWTGSLDDLAQGTSFTISLELQPASNGVYPGVFKVVENAEVYDIQLTLADGQFQFSEPGGRNFWGTSDGDKLVGFVAWKCFFCEHWGTFQLTRGTNAGTVDKPPAQAVDLVHFADLQDGATLAASLDPVTGLPTATVRVEMQGVAQILGLEADHLQVAMYDNTWTTDRHTETLAWTPWHGNGTYALTIEMLDWDNESVLDSETVSVNVTGIPDGSLTVQQRFAQIYREKIGLNFTSPPIARFSKFFSSSVDESRWISVVYYNDKVYEASIFDTGAVGFVNYDVNGANGYCRPMGDIRMLIVIVDYGNVSYDLNQLTSLLEEARVRSNRRWADYASGLGLSTPILQVQATTVFAGSPPTPGQALTSEQILSLTGYDTRSFDIITEVDLDANNSVAGVYGGLGVSLGGGCAPGGSQRVNIVMSQTEAATDILGVVGGSIFDHELTHGMGWMHWWPNGKADNRGWLETHEAWMPALLFGWTDTDGDGLIEINENLPYGLVP
jgi:hypothetical protein